MAAAQGRVRSRSGSGAPATRWAARLALVGIMGPVFYVVAIAAMHFLRPHDIVRYGNTISAYSVGPYGSISMAAFVALGLGGLALSAGLRRAVVPSRALRVGSVLVGVFGVGWVLAGIFRFGHDAASLEQAIKGENPTISEVIHGLGGFGGIFCLIVGMIVLSRAFARDERWRSFWPISLTLGLATLILFVFGLFVLNSPSVVPCCPTGSVAWWGAIEFRVFVGAFVLWLLLTSIRLRAVAKDSTPA
jgi:uncharacterized membrane protein YuzA (DUF378 family)/uncharacterized membrane protein